MSFWITGVVHGQRIELDHDPGLPDGSPVEVTIDADSRGLEERKKRLLALAGSWESDNELSADSP